MQIQEVQQMSNKMNQKNYTLRHFIIKLAKVKDKETILKAARKSKLPCKRTLL